MVSGTDSITLKLKQTMTLKEAEDFCTSAQQIIDDKKPEQLWIDCVENEAIEFPIIQILVAVVKHAKSNGIKIIWDNPSISLFERSMELGMDTALEL